MLGNNRKWQHIVLVHGQVISQGYGDGGINKYNLSKPPFVP